MAVLFGFLLLIAVGGLGVLGYFAFQLHTNVTRLEAESAAQRTRYEEDVKQRTEYCASVKTQYQGVVNKYNEDAKRWHQHAAMLKAENERLSRWKNVADAEIKANEMTRTAQAVLAKANTTTLPVNVRPFQRQHFAGATQPAEPAEANDHPPVDIGAPRQQPIGFLPCNETLPVVFHRFLGESSGVCHRGR